MMKSIKWMILLLVVVNIGHMEEGSFRERSCSCDHCNPLKKIQVQDCEAWYEYDTGAAYK